MGVARVQAVVARREVIVFLKGVFVDKAVVGQYVAVLLGDFFFLFPPYLLVVQRGGHRIHRNNHSLVWDMVRPKFLDGPLVPIAMRKGVECYSLFGDSFQSRDGLLSLEVA